MNTSSSIRRWVVLALILGLGLLIVACAGPQGELGPEGPPGPPGPQGPAGPPGGAFSDPPDYVGSEACAQCHADLYDTFMQSGHPYKLVKVVDGQPPEYPFSAVPDPPEGYTWDDILYVIGGYAWKARFVDKNGYIITGDNADATTQYNLANDELGKDAGWVGYHAGEAELPYDCGACHTTGYSDYPPDSHQDDLPGLVGTWALDGVQCEACHGPASLHVENPGNQFLRPEVTRDSELCGRCHVRGDVSQIDAAGGFVQHHEQYEEIYQSKHRALECVDCHNPHATTAYRDEAEVSGVRVECGSCHWAQQQFQSSRHPFKPQCETCHMAQIGKSAWADETRPQGDIPAHLFSINPFASEQFYQEGDKAFSYSYISLPFACGSCHYEGGVGGAKTMDELQAVAVGYHDRPAPTPAPTPGP